MTTGTTKLGVRQAAHVLAVSESAIYHWVEAGEIRCHLVNHQPLFNRDELLEWAMARRLRLSVELFADEGREIRLAPAIERGGVHHDVPGTDPTSALREIMTRLPIGDDAERELVIDVVTARGTNAVSGIGGGIAIPHVRSPIVCVDQPPAIAVCCLAHPIAFAASDDEPVTVVFAMMTPTVRGHLQLLSHLAHALHDEQLVAALGARGDATTILAEIARIDDAIHGKAAT